MSRKQQEPWRYKAGGRGFSVIVYERRGLGGVVYAKTWSQPDGRYLKKSLGYRMRDEAGKLIPERVGEAEAYALEQSAKLHRGAEALRQGQVRLGQVIRAYLEHRTPRKSLREQGVDERLAELWKRFLGAGKDPHLVSMREWESFIDQRLSGEIDGRGSRVPDPQKRRPVRPGTVGGDLDWLGGVFRWATRWRLASGTYLMRENPVRGFEVPTSANPRRPVASQDRYEVIRAKADEHTMEIRWNGKRTPARSYLAELLDITNGTGAAYFGCLRPQVRRPQPRADGARPTRHHPLASRHGQDGNGNHGAHQPDGSEGFGRNLDGASRHRRGASVSDSGRQHQAPHAAPGRQLVTRGGEAGGRRAAEGEPVARLQAQVGNGAETPTRSGRGAGRWVEVQRRGPEHLHPSRRRDYVASRIGPRGASGGKVRTNPKTNPSSIGALVASRRSWLS